MRERSISFVVLLAAAILMTDPCDASTIRAASCAQLDVQAAINSAWTGDLVTVPAGTCVWTSTVSIPPGKKIVLQGAGIDSTIITAGGQDTALNLTTSGSRLTGITLNQGSVMVDGDGWRIDHCKFHRATKAGEGVEVRGQRDDAHPTGLVDHCIFHNTRVLVIGDAGLLAHALWAQPLNLGSAAGVVYVEDCTFIATDFQNAIDANYGGRYVFRYNTLTDVYVEAHSVQGNNRAARKWEIYNNTFNQVKRAMWVPMYLRGGTGVVYNNMLKGDWNKPAIALDNVRSCTASSVSGRCNGSSPWDGNQAGMSGYPCRDQIGRSADASLWTSRAAFPPQALDPAYAWNNKYGASDVVFFQHNECAESVSHIQPNRDYFNNVRRPGYVAYTYPHPLVQGAVSFPGPPENLRVVEVVSD